MLRDDELFGKKAVITGSSSGIGFEFAALLVQNGCSVIINGRDEDKCLRAAHLLREISSNNAQVIPVFADVRTEVGRQMLFSHALKELGNIDILMLNVGYDSAHVGSLTTLPVEELNTILDVNIRSPILLSNLFLPEIAKRGGVVILIGSAASVRGSVVFGAYGLSKAALSNLTMSLAAEYGPSNVRVNCIAPAVVRTAFSEPLWTDQTKLAELERSYPLRRIGEPEEVAALALALCTRAGSWLTGQTILVDGGQMAAVGCRPFD